MNEIIKSSGPEIKNLIYEIRGKQVMLDSDLAKLYGVETRNLNKAVKRNIGRFPSSFMFQLNEEEHRVLMFQFGTSNKRGGTRKMPFAFTEPGVAMLSSVLHTETAIEVSVKIMNTFVAMRHFVGENLLEQKYINKVALEDHDLVKENTRNIKLLQKSFDEFKEKRKDHAIYFDGQFYDAYSTVLKIFSKAKKSLIIIDSYADHTLLDIIKRLKISVVLITTKTHLSSQDVEKYNEQYDNLEVAYDDTFHDRYFILDNKTTYHCGASINRIGYKTFSIAKVDDRGITSALLCKINALP